MFAFDLPGLTVDLSSIERNCPGKRSALTIGDRVPVAVAGDRLRQSSLDIHIIGGG